MVRLKKEKKRTDKVLRLRWAWPVQLYCKTNRIIHNNNINLSASPLVLEWLCFQQEKKNTWHGLLLTLTLPINILKVISVYSFPSPIPKGKMLNTGFLLVFLLQLPLGERDWRRQNKQKLASGVCDFRRNYSLRGNVSCAFSSALTPVRTANKKTQTALLKTKSSRDEG